MYKGIFVLRIFGLESKEIGKSICLPRLDLHQSKHGLSNKSISNIVQTNFHG